MACSVSYRRRNTLSPANRVVARATRTGGGASPRQGRKKSRELTTVAVTAGSDVIDDVIAVCEDEAAAEGDDYLHESISQELLFHGIGLLADSSAAARPAPGGSGTAPSGDVVGLYGGAQPISMGYNASVSERVLVMWYDVITWELWPAK